MRHKEGEQSVFLALLTLRPCPETTLCSSPIVYNSEGSLKGGDLPSRALHSVRGLQTETHRQISWWFWVWVSHLGHCNKVIVTRGQGKRVGSLQELTTEHGTVASLRLDYQLLTFWAKRMRYSCELATSLLRFMRPIYKFLKTKLNGTG